MIAALNQVTAQYEKRKSLCIKVIDAVPVLSSAEGEQWCRGLNHALDAITACSFPQAIMVWDDDQLLSEPALEEIRGHLGAFAHDRYDIRSLFTWDRTDRVNATAAMLNHWSAALFRYVPGDRFPDDFVVPCTRRTARSTNFIRLTHPALNFGYMTAEDRQRCWTSAVAAGRLDAFTREFNNPNPPTTAWPFVDETPSESKPSTPSPNPS